MKREDEVDRAALLWFWPRWPGPLYRYAVSGPGLLRGSRRTRTCRELLTECSGEINSNGA